MDDLEHAQFAQAENEQRRMREDELLRRAKILTREKKLTDEEFRIEWQKFTQEINRAACK